MNNNPLLTETPTVTINGQELQLPRVTISTTFKITKFANKVLDKEVLDVLSNNQGIEDASERGLLIVQTLLDRVGDAEEDFYALLSDVLGLSVEEVMNIPLDEMAQLFNALKEHPDVGFIKTKLTQLLKQ